jgi:outer membrane protein
MKRTIALLASFIALAAHAQDSTKWDLRKLVDYAMKNNISVKQAEVQARIAAIQAKQLELYKIPTATFSTNLGPQFGRSIDPTTNTYTNTELFAQNYGIQGGVQVYNWGRIKNSTAASQFNARAALASVEKAANDVALNVAVYYLNILVSYENVKISKAQIQQTLARIIDTKKRVEAGSLPELNLVELQSQLAVDSTSLITNETSFKQNILFMKGLLNIDAAKPFEVETPSIDKIPVENLLDLMPESVYQLALNNQPQQKVNDLKIKAAEKNILASKAEMYPTVSANYSLGSTYNNKAVNFFTGNKIQYFDQLNQNFRQVLGVGLQVPILNSGIGKSNYLQAKENLKAAQLQQEQANQTLKNDIYTAYTNATASMQKYYASLKQVESAKRAYEISVKRYEIGMLSTLDLIINTNNLEKALVQNLSNQFDYVFRMKLLEFYKGQGLKL